MLRYVALLRGINVGGNTMIRMEELRAMFEALRFERVASYINSGNLAFDVETPVPESSLVASIESEIEKEFGMQISVMIRSQVEISNVIASNPFAGEFESHKEMHVLFLRELMPAEAVEQLSAAANEGERFAVRHREIYCHLKLGVANSLLGKDFIEKKLKVPTTARNWRTVLKLAEL